MWKHFTNRSCNSNTIMCPVPQVATKGREGTKPSQRHPLPPFSRLHSGEKKQMVHGVLSWWLRTLVGHTARFKKDLLVNSTNPKLKKQETESIGLCTRDTKKDVKAKEYGNIDSIPNSFLGIEIRPRIISSLSVVMWLTCSTRFSLDWCKWVTFIKLIRTLCLARRAGCVKVSTRWNSARGAS